MRFLQAILPQLCPSRSPLNRPPQLQKEVCVGRDVWDRLQQTEDSAGVGPVLRPPNPQKPFIMHVDACDSGIGAVLSQMGEDGTVYPCSYF